MGTDKGQQFVLSYVLRMWRTRNGERSVWRASLQDVRSGERMGFAGLDEVARFLRAQTGYTPGEERGRSTQHERAEGQGHVPHEGREQ